MEEFNTIAQWINTSAIIAMLILFVTGRIVPKSVMDKMIEILEKNMERMIQENKASSELAARTMASELRTTIKDGISDGVSEGISEGIKIVRELDNK